MGGNSYHGKQQESKRCEQKHVMPLKVVIWNGNEVISTHGPLAKTNLIFKSGADGLGCLLHLFYSEVVSSHKAKRICSPNNSDKAGKNWEYPCTLLLRNMLNWHSGRPWGAIPLSG